MRVMDELYTGIETGLGLVKECAVYREELPADHVRPAFLTGIYRLEVSGGLNGGRKNTVSFDVRYYPEAGAGGGVREGCWQMGCELGRRFEAPGFRVKNRNMRIEDNVLHFFFDIAFTDYDEQSVPQMRELSKHTGFKEE